jgi:pyruvate formate lyase activating enzyme
MKNPLILEIRGNSLDDGPGIRSVVFFKGCPLSCVWCHNPESKRAGAELSFDPAECVACDTCVKLCPEKALSRKKSGFIDRDKCTLCFDCAAACPAGALSRVGREMSVGDIMESVLRDRPFYDNSGGGVTLSGGEPALFIDFSSELLRELRKKKIHTLLETCGLFDWDAFAEKMIPYLDTVYFDIKLMDGAAHKKHCGVSNEKILANFERLIALAAKKKVYLLPRTPLVPGITDTEENLAAIAGYLRGLGVKKTALLPYNPMWHEKSGKIGAADHLAGKAEASTWMSRERIEACRAIFTDRGIDARS